MAKQLTPWIRSAAMYGLPSSRAAAVRTRRATIGM